MSSDSFPESESAYYRRLFESIINRNFNSNSNDNDVNDSEAGYVSGLAAADLLQRTGLSRSVLHEIWQLADVHNEGRLDLPGFSIACRLASHAQNMELSSSDETTQNQITADLATVEPPHLLKLLSSEQSESPDNHNLNPNSNSSQQSQPIPNSDATDVFDWTPSEQDLREYLEVFENLSLICAPNTNDSSNDPNRPQQQQYVDGEQAKKLFGKAQLLQEDLSLIWDMSDIDCDGRLDKKEFCIAMHLITSLQRPNVSQLPTKLPQQLADLKLPTTGTLPPPSVSDSAIAGPSEQQQQSLSQCHSQSHSTPTQQATPLTAAEIEQKLASGADLISRAWKAEATIQNELLAPQELEYLEERMALESEMKRKRQLDKELNRLQEEVEGISGENAHKEVEYNVLNEQIDGIKASNLQYEQSIEQMESEILLLTELSNTARNGGGKENFDKFKQNLLMELGDLTDSNAFRTQILEQHRMESELLKIDNNKVQDMRFQLKNLSLDLEQVLHHHAISLEKLRLMEQDRTLLLTAVEGQKSKLLIIREERIKLLLERCELKALEAKLIEQISSKPSYLWKINNNTDAAYSGGHGGFTSLESEESNGPQPSRIWETFGSNSNSNNNEITNSNGHGGDVVGSGILVGGLSSKKWETFTR